MGDTTWIPLIVQGLTILAGGGGVVFGTIQLFANRRKVAAEAANTSAGTLQIANAAITGALVPLNEQIKFLTTQLATANATNAAQGEELSAAHAATRALRREFEEFKDAVAECNAGMVCPVQEAILLTGHPRAGPEGHTGRTNDTGRTGRTGAGGGGGGGSAGPVGADWEPPDVP